MPRSQTIALTGLLALVLANIACAGACGGKQESTCEVTGEETPPPSWQAVCDQLDATRVPRELSFQVGDKNGAILTYTRGDVTPQTRHRIASASKWMASAVIMRLVERGELSLEDHPQDYISWWTSDPEDPRSKITLAQLLSFTSGFGGSPLEVTCVNRTRLTFEECGKEMYDEYFLYNEPGKTFYYGPVHMHFAAMMAEGATGKSWNELFVEEVVTPLGMGARTHYAIAGPEHPRIAGGIESSGEDYAKFLQAILAGTYLSASIDAISTDYTPSDSVTLAHTPLTDAGFEWHYGLGLWRECASDTFTNGCNEHIRISSPGAYGFYPWLDRRHEYWAVLSTKESILQNPAKDSVLMGVGVQPLIERAYAGH